MRRLGYFGFRINDEEKQSIAEIYRLTSGIARGICKLANEALLRAVIEKKKVVDRDTVIAAAADAFEEV